MSAFAVEVSFASRDGRPLRGALSALVLLGFAVCVSHAVGAAVAAEASVYSVQASDGDDVAAAKKSLSEGLKVFGRLPLTAAPPASPPPTRSSTSSSAVGAWYVLPSIQATALQLW